MPWYPKETTEKSLIFEIILYSKIQVRKLQFSRWLDNAHATSLAFIITNNNILLIG